MSSPDAVHQALRSEKLKRRLTHLIERNARLLFVHASPYLLHAVGTLPLTYMLFTYQRYRGRVASIIGTHCIHLKHSIN